VTRFAACVLLVLFTTSWSSAQQSPVRSTLEGTITDGSHRPIASASLEIVNPLMGESHAADADSRGNFRVTGLRIGTYEVHAKAPGFSNYRQTEIVLTVNQTVRLTIELAPAQVKAEITVTTPPLPLDVSQTSVTSVIDHERIEELPVRTRNALDFVLLAPGVSPASTQTGSGSQSAFSTSGFSFGGLRARSNNISIDGLDNNDEFIGASRTELSPEIVSEFQIINNGISAEFGGASGGSVNVVTRSGANEMHGDTFLFAQNGALNARPSIESEAGKPDLSRYRAGLANGGAIKKNQTFYYAAFEQEHEREQGDSILDPSLTSSLNNYLATGADPRLTTRTLNPGFFPTSRAETEASARLDQQLGTSNSLMFRYAFTNNREASQAFNNGGINDPSAAGSSFIRDNAFGGSLLSTLSPTMVNDLRFQIARRHALLRTNDELGPEIDIAGLLNFGRPYVGNDARTEDHYEGSDTFSWNRGAHLLKIGSVVNRVNLNSYAPDGFGGVYLFSSLAAFLARQPEFFLQTFGNPSTSYAVTSYGNFFQDHWSVSRRLTLDLGVRYDFEKLPGLFRQDTHNVSPRIGFAYSPTARWVIRGGFGIFYDRYTLANLNRAMEMDGQRAFQQVANGPLATALFQQSGGGALSKPATGIAPSIFRPDSQLATPYSAQTSISAERQITTNITLALSYLFVRGIKLPRTRNINLAQPVVTPMNSLQPSASDIAAQQLGGPFFGPDRLDPRFNDIYQLENSASSTYHGLSVSLNRRLAQEFEFSANYTLSKTTDDASDFNEQPQNPYDLRADRGPSRNDQRHRLVVNGTFDLPIGDEDVPGTHQNFFTKVFKNIEMAPIVTVQTGQPVNPLTGLDSNQSQAWPLSARPAGYGRNALRTPATAAVDFRVLKFFPFGEHSHLDLVAESFNLLNRTNVSQINPFFGSGSAPLAGFGTPTEALNARQIQFSLDFEY
jgi:Carboxypeptidase regulatory-like domain/TonB-dependent Receptor Plug Domain